jgi:hypothetical protein
VQYVYDELQRLIAVELVKRAPREGGSPGRAREPCRSLEAA